jgi:integrase
VRDFLAAVADDRLMPAYRLLVSTGMRRGEVLGLRWSDVDLAKGRLSVNSAGRLWNVADGDIRVGDTRRSPEEGRWTMSVAGFDPYSTFEP